MLPEHRDIQRWIKEKYSAQFEVLAEIDKTNYLPDRDRHWYQPDVVLRSRKNPKNIRYIIEVENDPMRKAIVGACLLADCSVKEMCSEPAALIFIVYSEIGRRQIKNFKDRIEVIKGRLTHLSSIQAVTVEEFKRGKGLEIRPTRKKRAEAIQS